jgi:hypothetical protein
MSDEQFKKQPGKADWLYLSIASCLFFGSVNYVLGDMCSRLGLDGQFLIGNGMILMWLCFHVANPKAK